MQKVTARAIALGGSVAVLLNPRFLLWLAVAGLIAFVLAFTYRAGKATVRADFDAYKLEVSNANRIASDLARKEGDRRQSEFEAAAESARQENAALQADVVRLAGSADGLRDDLAAFKRRAAARACPADRGKGEPDSGASDLLGELYLRSVGTNRELAEFAQRLRTTGAACERSADAMTVKSAR